MLPKTIGLRNDLRTVKLVLRRCLLFILAFTSQSDVVKPAMTMICHFPSKHKDVFVTLWRRSVNVSETLRFYVIVALSCQFFFAVITTYTNYVILKRF